MIDHLNVLLLEDNPVDTELILAELRRTGYDVKSNCVDNRDDYLDAPASNPDIILADYTLPQFDALAALQLMQERELDIPFIVVTGSVSEEAAVTCMRQGASDYLLKDRLARLGEAIRYALAQKSLREDKLKAEQALYEANAELERRVAERTTQLRETNELLQQQIAERIREARELAALEERNRIARDLHDAVTQTLYSASMITAVLPEIWRRNPEEGQHTLGELNHMLESAVAEMRTLLLELRPDSLLESSLGELLERLAVSLARRRGASIMPIIQAEIRLPAEVQIAFYRIAQEALNNAIHHANAGEVSLRLEQIQESVTMIIEDQGQGFEVGAVKIGSHGLTVMRERASSIGALFDVWSEPEMGTRITVTWTGKDTRD